MADEEEDPVDEEPEEAPEAQETGAETPGARWNWWLVALPVVAVLDLIVVLLYGANMLSVQDIHADAELLHVVLAGLAILLILLVIEAVLLMGGHPENLEDEEEPAPGPETPAAREDVPAPAAEKDQAAELEAVETDDEVEGRRVLELARPPKGIVDAGVYSTTYVEIDTEQVLRVEELVAQKTA